MRNRLARLDTIYTYIVEHPYSTCRDISEYIDRRIGLVRSDIRSMYRAGLLGRRKVDNSKTRTCDSKSHEYYAKFPPRKLDS